MSLKRTLVIVVAVGVVMGSDGLTASADGPVAGAVLVSVGTGGAPANGDSDRPTISGSGRFIAFASAASNLVAADTNGKQDVFVRDLTKKVTTRVSVGAGGLQANGASLDPSISDDGRYIAFSSAATNLVVGDTNNALDVFVHDRVAHLTTRISVATNGAQGNGNSYVARIAAGGKHVAFVSLATNLTPGADANNGLDVFLRDIIAATTERVSSSSTGTAGNAPSSGPSISANGSRVAFTSDATDVGPSSFAPNVFVRDRITNVTWAIPAVAYPFSEPVLVRHTPALSRDGKRLAFVAYYLEESMYNFEYLYMVVVSVPAMKVLKRDFVATSYSDISGNTSETSAPRLPRAGTNGAVLVISHRWDYYEEPPVITDASWLSRLVPKPGAQLAGCDTKDCLHPGFDVSADGRRAVLAAMDSGWVADDTNGRMDIFLVPA